MDSASRLLGTPPHALVVASSEGHTDNYLVAPEEVPGGYYHGLTGSQSNRISADVVFFETSSGGAVFSTGSIAWAGSLCQVVSQGWWKIGELA